MNVLYGRSSSHFTRVARVFAAELAVPYMFEIILDLLSTDASDYGDNPALKLPTLHTSSDIETDRRIWFGTLNICRELARRSPAAKHVIWPEDLSSAVAGNAHEYVTHAMATEVTLLMNRFAGGDPSSKHQEKLMTSLQQTMSWLEDNHESYMRELPRERDLSYLEVSLFCLVEHLEFREVLSTQPYSALRAFAEAFAKRESAKATTYRIDT